MYLTRPRPARAQVVEPNVAPPADETNKAESSKKADDESALAGTEDATDLIETSTNKPPTDKPAETGTVAPAAAVAPEVAPADKTKAETNTEAEPAKESAANTAKRSELDLPAENETKKQKTCPTP